MAAPRRAVSAQQTWHILTGPEPSRCSTPTRRGHAGEHLLGYCDLDVALGTDAVGTPMRLVQPSDDAGAYELALTDADGTDAPVKAMQMVLSPKTSSEVSS